MLLMQGLPFESSRFKMGSEAWAGGICQSRYPRPDRALTREGENGQVSCNPSPELGMKLAALSKPSGPVWGYLADLSLHTWPQLLPWALSTPPIGGADLGITSTLGVHMLMLDLAQFCH